MKAFILSLACSLLLSGPFLSELAAEPPHLPPPARELGRRPPDRGGDAGRAAQLRSSAAALGLSGLKLGGNPDFPSAIYGAGSGTIPGRTANEAARGFLTAFAPFYGLPHADLQKIETEQRPGFLPGYSEVIAQRTVEGRPLYGARLRIHIGPGGEFLAALGDLYGELTWAGEPTLTGDEAAARATSVIDRIVKPEGIGPVRGATSPDAGITEAAYPLGARARPAFVVSGVVAANGIDLFEVVVDGISGQILEIVALTAYAQGQVFRNAAELPQSPQPSATPGIVPPSPNPPDYVSRVTIPLTILGTTELKGNNTTVREYQSWTGSSLTNTSGNLITEASGDFSFALLLGSGDDIRNYPYATGTNLYYVNNFARDYFWALGFDEAHGNFQVDNFGQGGLGGDPVVAFTQLGSGSANGQNAYASNNAFMSTPADGFSPKMGMYVFAGSGTAPNRIYKTDSSLDPEIVLHEFTHGVTGRLAAGSLPYTRQSGAMNEGNSDFFALNILTPSSAPLDGAYPIGAYALQRFSSGIRFFPYSTSLTVNPLTYADFGNVHSSGPQVHSDGEIWASALWEARAALIATLGFDTGRTRVGQLVVDALQLLPNAPTFVDFRNAVLAADRARYGGAHLDLLWGAFAKRGLGVLAAGGTNAYSAHVLADGSLPSPAARIRLWETDYYLGESIRILVADSNASTPTVTVTTSSGDSETFTLVPSGETFTATAVSEEGAPVSGDGKVQLSAGDTITATTTDGATEGETPSLQAAATTRPPYMMAVLGSSSFDAGDAPSLAFKGDELAAKITLPFTFSFFGVNYSSVYIADNGLLSFDFAMYIRARDLGEPGLAPIVAPFSVDLDCSAGGVYYYVGTDRLTIRWNCVEYDAPANAANVAVHLFPDHSIRFDYGSGNNLTGDDYYTGLPDIAMVGIGRGTETFAQPVSGYNGATSLGNAPSVVFVPDDGIIPLPPSGVLASSQSPANVVVDWAPVGNATSYQVERKSAGGDFVPIGTTAETSYDDTTASADLAYLYRVRAMRGSTLSNPSAADLATTLLFTDDPLTSGIVVKAAHLSELRTAVSLVRDLAGLPAALFTDETVAGTTARAVHVTELRSFIDEARTALGLPASSYTDVSLTGIVIKAAHFVQLRGGVR